MSASTGTSTTDDAGTQTGLDIEMEPEQPVLGRRAKPPSLQDLAKRAAVGDSVVMSEMESGDFLQAVQDFIDYAQNRAWPELEQDIRLSEKTLAEQIEDVTFKRGPEKQLEDSLAAKRRELQQARDEYKAIVDALAGVRGGVNNGKRGADGDNAFKKWKYGQDERKAQIQAKIDRIKVEISAKEEKLNKLASRFSQVPNESVYSNAFEALAMSVDIYVDKIRKATDRVMRSRKDGPLLKIDRDAFDEAADALGKVFASTENALLALLTYQNSAVNERNTVKLYDGSLKIDLKNVENATSDLQAGRLAVYERVRINRYNAINAAIRAVETVHRESARKITKPISFHTSVDQFDIGLMYALKMSRLGLLLAASYVASRVFENIYVERMSVKDPKMPDLKWVVFAFMVTATVFDLVVLGVAYFVAKILPRSIDMRLIQDFAVDTLVAHTMAGISLFPLADVVQDRRYFDFQITASRALRLMRHLCFATAGFHALVPYFYLTGPFYMQHKKAATEDVL